MKRIIEEEREKLNGKKSERETNHEKLLTMGKELRVARGEVEGWDKYVMDIKEGT